MIPLTFFVLLYSLFVIVTLVFAVVNVYHILVTGTLNLLSFTIAAGVVVAMVAVIVTTAIYLGTVDVNATWSLFSVPTTIPTL